MKMRGRRRPNPLQIIESEAFLRKMLGGMLLLLLFLTVVVAAVQRLTKSAEKDMIGDGLNRASYASGTRVRILQQRAEGEIELLPDRRYLFALAEISRLYSAAPPNVLRVGKQEGKWLIRADDKPVGVIDDLPDYSDLVTLLLAWVRVQESVKPINLLSPEKRTLEKIERQLGAFFADEIALPLKKLDALWLTGERSREGVQLALRGIVFLLLQLEDATEVADGLWARALALLGILKAVGYTTPEECLLAAMLGYSAAADRCVQSLPESDPTRFYLAGNQQRLKEVAEGAMGSRFTRYLYLLRLSASDSPREMNDWVKRYFADKMYSPALLRLYATDANTPEQEAIIRALPFAVLGELLTQGGEEGLPERQDDGSVEGALQSVGLIGEALGRSTGEAVRRFEEALRRLPLGQIFSGAEVFVDYYRAFFYSALFRHGMRLLDSEEGDKFVAAVGAGKDALTVQFRNWYQLLLTRGAGDEATQQLLGNLGTSPLFGAPLRATALKMLVDRLGSGTTFGRRGTEAFIDAGDSRPSNRALTARFVREELYNLDYADRLTRSVIETDPLGRERELVEFARLSNDPATLERLSASPRLSCSARLLALQSLESYRGLSRPTMTERYRQLNAQWPENAEVLVALAASLNDEGKSAVAQTKLEEWLKVYGGKRRSEVGVRVALAQSLTRDRKFLEAWQTLAPAIEAKREEAMIAGVRVLQDLGREDSAELLAKLTAEGFPQSAEARVEYTRVLWGRGKYVLATAPLLGVQDAPLAAEWRKRVAPAFVTFTRDYGEKKAQEVFAALRQQGARSDLLELLTAALAKDKQAEFAFRLQVELLVDALDPNASTVTAYQYLRKAKGAEVAQEWLRERLRALSIEELAAVLFSSREHDLLWNAALFAAHAGDEQYLWCVRAAAYALDSERFAQRKTDLLRSIDARNRRLHSLLTQYLMGQAARDEVLSATYDKKSRAEASYFFAVASLGKREYSQATVLLQEVLDNGNREQREYRWAAGTLAAWVESGKTLRLLEKEGVY